MIGGDVSFDKRGEGGGEGLRFEFLKIVKRCQKWPHSALGDEKGSNGGRDKRVV